MTALAPHLHRPRLPRRGLVRLVRTEFRLFLRDPGGVFFALAFPTVLLLGMGLAIPGLRDQVTGAPEYAGLQVIDLWGPVVIATAVATTALSILPAYLAGYREHGVFRRLSTTPMRPGGVLLAQAMVTGAALVFAIALAVTAGLTVLGMPAPARPGLLLGAILLAAVALFPFGLLIGGLAPKAATASGIGMLLYFPMLFFAGLWVPIMTMPDLLAAIATLTPLGAASEAMNAAWFDGAMPWRELAVMAAYGVVGFPVAARLFRWS